GYNPAAKLTESDIELLISGDRDELRETLTALQDSGIDTKELSDLAAGDDPFTPETAAAVRQKLLELVVAANAK
ncbi:hypothetical protein, partial [Nocardia sp. NPDC004722]